jgi:hypothetical protein
VQPYIRVLRSPPRPRDRVEGICGRIYLKLRVCSRDAGDTLDSYLHIGSGGFQLSVKEENVLSLASLGFWRAVERLKEEEIERMPGSFNVEKGMPVISGSSVKGNVRSRIELSFIPGDGAIRSCLIRSTPSTREPREGEEGWKHYRIWIQSLRYNRGPPCDYTSGEGGVCLVCDIFGTSGLQGLVSFSEFVGVNVELVNISELQIEAAPPGSEFSGSIDFTNLNEEELGLLLYGMGIRDSFLGIPVLMGKYKYRSDLRVAFGKVRYKLTGLALSSISKPLVLSNLTLNPGEKIEGGELEHVARELVNTTRGRFGKELLDVDEVIMLEKLR